MTNRDPDVRLLGSGGFVPTRARETACVYLRRGDQVLLLDAGTGLSRLLEEPHLLDGVRRLDIVLSHFHLDHTAGLAYLSAFGHVPERLVWGPGPLVAGQATRELLHRLLDPPFGAADEEDVETRVATTIRDYGPPTLDLGSFSLQTRVQTKHLTPTIAVRVNGGLVYCTDTGYDRENAAFARGARLLLHDAYYAVDESPDPTHTAAGEAGKIAADAEVDRLVLVHINPRLEDENDLRRFAQARFPTTEVGRDGPLEPRA